MQNTIRYALYLLIVSGLLFAACATESTTETREPEEMREEIEAEESEVLEENTEEVDAQGDETDADEESGIYEDGTYTSVGTYASPAGMDTIGVTLTLENDKVTAVSIENQATNEVSIQFIDLFAAGIGTEIIGKSLDEIGGYSSINGSSLTPDGFDSALASIKADAAL